jgi:hypothetical protein
MNSLAFIASLVSSLAWPLVFLAAIFIMRSEVAKLLLRLANVKLPGGIEASFREVLEQARETIEEIEVEQPPRQIEQDDPEQKRLEQLAAQDPNAAVGEAYNIMYQTLVSDKLPKRRTRDNRISYLGAIGAIDHETYELFNQLSRMRDFASYSRQVVEPSYDTDRIGKITTEEAIEYIKQTRLLKRVLEDAISKLPVLTREEY